MSKTQVLRVELLIVNHDKLTRKDLTSVLEGTEYPNHCMHPSVMKVQEAEVDWSDNHPLNGNTTQEGCYKSLFKLGWFEMGGAPKDESVLLVAVDKHGNRNIFDAHYSDGSPSPDAEWPAHEPGWYYSNGTSVYQPVPGKPVCYMEHPLKGTMQQVLGKATVPTDPKLLKKIEF